MENNKQIVLGKVGMNSSAHPSTLGENEYTYALNTTYEGFDGGGVLNLQPEPSSILCSEFEDGYKVIKVHYDINDNKVYFFLVNPITLVSEIGFISGISNVVTIEDVEASCGCNYRLILAEPLEEQEGVPSCVYTTLINDSCNKCLGFSLEYPIKDVVIKNEKTGKNMYFAGANNPPRFLKLDKIDDYKYYKKDICEDEPILNCNQDPLCIVDCEDCNECPDCESMLVFGTSNKLCTKPDKLINGGNLKMGSYYFLAAYCDAAGNELSEYYLVSPPVHIFDGYNNIIEQPQLNKETHYGIKLTIEGLDDKFDYYKIAVIQSTALDGSLTYYEEGVHPTNVSEVVYTSEHNKKRLLLTEIVAVKTKWKYASGMVSSGGYLYQYGLEEEQEINLQPMAILLSPFLRWIMGVANEDLYKDGVADAKYGSWMRNEVYPVSLKFFSSDGRILSPIILTNRPPTVYEEEVIVTRDVNGDVEGTNDDLKSVLAYGNECEETRDKRWQFYNTATVTGQLCDVDELTGITVEQTGEVECNVDVFESTSYKNITLTGTSGTANITIGGVVALATFNINLTTTAANWVTANAAAVLADSGAVVTAALGVIKVTDVTTGFPVVSIVNVSGDLAGAVGTLTATGYTLTFTYPEEYTTFEEFLNNYINEFCVAGLYEDATLCSIITDDYSALNCDPTDFLGEDCVVVGVSPIAENLEFFDVAGVVETNNYKTIGEYTPSDSPEVCSVYKIGTDEFSRVLETDLSVLETVDPAYIPPLNPNSTVVYKRNINTNLTCITAIPLINAATGSRHLEYAADTTDWTNLQQNILTGIDSQLDGDNRWFTTKLHEKSIWFETDFAGEDTLILEITPRADCEIPDDSLVDNKWIRVSIFEACPAPAGSSVEYFEIDVTVGAIIELDKANYPADDIIVIAIDSPIQNIVAVADPTTYVGDGYVNPPCGCFDILKRDKEIKDVTVTWSGMKLKNIQKYETLCTYIVPEVDDCDVLPYTEGKFGYWESTRTYPDNKELFDASEMIISSSNIPVAIKTEFEDIFSDGVDVDGNYILNADTNLRCKPIRHYKMPPNGGINENEDGVPIAPFMLNIPQPAFRRGVIFPLGVKIDNTVINFFLDSAVTSGLMTQVERDKIVGYEVLRGDRTLDKSIIAKGLLFDTYKYQDENDKTIYYPNYPYNCLGNDKLHNEIGTTTSIEHPFNSNSNNRFTFHSPDTHFLQPPPFLPNEIEYEGYQYGASKGKFDEVENHPKYVILGRNAYITATTLATIEIALETVIIIGDAYGKFAETFRAAVVTADVNPAGMAAALAHFASLGTALVTATYRVGRKRYEWLTLFRNNGKPRNFAYKFAGHGWYNNLSYEHNLGNVLRGLSAAHYLKGGGRFTIVENDETDVALVNNVDRESSVYLSLGSTYNLSYTDRYKNYDNYNSNQFYSSRRVASDADNCGGGEFDSNIASPYISLKSYRPDQYGDVHNIKWLSTGYCGKLETDNSCDIIFGGDIRISRMSLKRKLPMFLVDAYGQSDYTPFAYSLYNNIGAAKYYINFDIELDDAIGTTLANAVFPEVGSDGSYDCLQDGNNTTKPKPFYLKPPAKFYTSYYGIPQFLVESEINLNYRYARREAHEWFYPNGGTADYNWWTQEKNVTIKHDNEYNYNFNYSRNLAYEKRQMLPVTYNKADWTLKARFQNGIIASQLDSTETNTNDPWLNYKPSDVYEFPSSAGKLVDVRDIESNQMLARFKNQFMVLNSFDVLRERLTENNSQLGTGIFGQRPIEFNKTNLGYGGTQHKEMTSSEFGHVWVDAMRGSVHKIDPNGKNALEISAYKPDGSPSGMRNWFKENLPFKILRGGITGLTENDVDNSYAGIGITMTYDSKFRRILLTKKDAIVKEEWKNKLSFIDNGFYVTEGLIKIEADNTTYFEDASFTISYHFPSNSWASFFSFKPNYYISHQHYFQSGFNSPSSKLYSHLLTNRSYRVFNGEKFPWVIEMPNKEKFTNSVLSSIEYWLDSKVYLNEYDFSENRKIGFDKAYLYNNSKNSGEIRLVNDEENNRFLRTQYPKISSNGFTEILQSEFNNRFTFNSFYNQVRDENNNLNHWIHDNNGLKESINNKAMDFSTKKKGRLNGDWFLIRLESNNDTRYKQIFKFLFSKENTTK